MTAEQKKQESETKQPASRATGMKVLIAANTVAALVLLAMFPQYTGGRALLYLCAGVLHSALALGLHLRQGWASIVMIAYALFQVAGMGLWSLISLMTLAAEPMSEGKAHFLILAAIVIPFLGWTVVYLLRQLRKTPAS